MKLSLWQKIQLKLSGNAFLEYRRKPGWSGSLPFYVFRCPKHGLMEDYPHGYQKELRCIECFKEAHG